jgi:hypothetical protein
MDFHGNIDLKNNEMQNLVFQLETTKGTTAAQGALAFEGHTLFLSIGTTGNDPMWIPISNQIDTHIHEQNSSSSTWTVSHNLGSIDPLVQVYDINNSMIIPNTVDVVNSHVLIITLSTAIIGRAIIIAGIDS